MNPQAKTPPIQGIVETAINVSDMTRAREFYISLFGFEMMEGDDRFCAFRVGRNVLLLFAEGESGAPVQTPGGVIPPHESLGAGHFALAISADDYEPWRSRIFDRGIEIESEVCWGRGGRSIYFRDTDNNLLELVTPGIWVNY